MLSRIETESHCIVIGVNRIASLAASCVSSIYCIVGDAHRIGLSYQMYIPNIYIYILILERESEV